MREQMLLKELGPLFRNS